MIAGQIEIQMMADLVRLKRDMDEVKGLLRTRASDFTDFANTVRNALGGIGLGLTIDQLVQFGRELTQVKVRAESLATTLDFATGGRTAAEMAYLQRITRDLGLEFQSTAVSYAKAAAAARGTSLEGEGMRKVFEAVAKASAVMGLSIDDSQGVMLALNQMISKGTVQSEELRGQLGERLPGAFQIAARAMGVTTEELGKMLEQGLVPASAFLPKFAAQLEQELGGAAENAAGRTQAALNRLSNAWEAAKLLVAEGLVGSGGANMLTAGIEELTESMRRARAQGEGWAGQQIAAMNALLRLSGASSETALSVAGLEVQLRNAEAELKRLQEGARANPGNIFLTGFIAEADELVARLREARNLKEYFGTSQSFDMGKGIAAAQRQAAEDQAKADLALAAARSKSLGVNEAYQKQLMELYQWHLKGNISLEAYQEAAMSLTAATYKKAVAHKASADAFAAERAAAQEWAKVMEDARRIGGEAEAQTDDLSRAQKRLVEYLTSPAYQTNSADMREMALAELYAAHAKEEHAKQAKTLAKIQAEAHRAAEEFIDNLKRQADMVVDQVAAAEDEARAVTLSAQANISLAEAVARVAIERLRERQVSMLGNPDAVLALQREIEAREQLMTLMRGKELRQANATAARQLAMDWEQTAHHIGDTLEQALVAGGEGAKRILEREFANLVLRPIIQGMVGPIAGMLSSMLTGYSGGGGAAGGMGGLGSYGSLLNSVGSMYSTVAGWMGGGTTAAVTGPQIYGSMAALEGITVAEGASAATAGAGAASAGSSAAAAIPIIGWIAAALMASNAAYKGGNTIDMLDDGDRKWGVGAFETDKYKTLSKIGFSDKWAQILSGAPITARLFGHKASSSGFGVGSIADGDFVQTSARPFEFGANTLGTGVDPMLQGVAAQIAAQIGMSASTFGGGLTEGMRIGAFTDNDREGKSAALLGFLGANDKLIAGVQTGSGAFGAGGPGGDAAKIESSELNAWLSEQMPLLIVQGLQQSDLDARFETYFSSIAPASLTAEKAASMLQLASSVQAISVAFEPLGTVFAQFDDLSVALVKQLADMNGGFDALSQTVGTYYSNFYTEAERTAAGWDSITQTLNEAGITTIPTTRAEFRALVDGLGDLSTTADQDAFTALMKVSGAFAQLVPSAEDLARAAAEQQTAFDNTQLQLQIDLMRAMGDELGAVALERQTELDMLAALEIASGKAAGSLTGMQQAIYDAADAAAAAKRSFSQLETLEIASSALKKSEATRNAANYYAGITDDMIIKLLSPGNRILYEASGDLSLFREQYKQLIAIRRYDADQADNRSLGTSSQTNSGSDVNPMDALVAERLRQEEEAMRLWQQGVQDQIKTNERLIGSVDNLHRSLDAWYSDLIYGDRSILNPEQRYQQSSAELWAIDLAAIAGDLEATASWKDAANTFLDQSDYYFGGGTGYALDQQRVLDAYARLEAQLEQVAANTRASNAGLQQQIDLMTSQNETAQATLDHSKLLGQRAVGAKG